MSNNADSFFAIVYDDVIHVPGDERSQLYPGHGYPAHTITKQVFRELKTREELERAVITAEESTKGTTRTYRVLKCSEVKVSVNRQVNIED